MASELCAGPDLHADGEFLCLGFSGPRIGPFSSHWAACAAMIRVSNRDFTSIGGDSEDDLRFERTALRDALAAYAREGQ